MFERHGQTKRSIAATAERRPDDDMASPRGDPAEQRVSGLWLGACLEFFCRSLKPVTTAHGSRILANVVRTDQAIRPGSARPCARGHGLDSRRRVLDGL